MEEEKELNMGLFDSNLELNNPIDFPFTQDPDDEKIEEEGIEPSLEQNKTVEEGTPEEVDGEEDGQNEGENEGSKSSSNLYSSVAALVHEQGFLPSLDIEKTKFESWDDLGTAFDTEIETRAKAKFEQYIDNLDIEQVAQSKKTIQRLSNLTEEDLKGNLDLAKKIIYDDYISQGLDERKATKYLKRLIDLGEEAILEESAESLNSLKEFDSKRIEQEKQEAIKQLEQEKIQQAKLDEHLKKTIYENKSLISGYTPTKAMQDKVYHSINEIVGKSPEGYFENKFMKERRENPIEFETRMYYFYELTNGFKDYSKLTTSAQSKAVKDLERIAKQTQIKDNGTPIWMQDGESYATYGSELNL